MMSILAAFVAVAMTLVSNGQVFADEVDETQSSLVSISEENFPDKIFRSYIMDNIDADKDGFLSEEEINGTQAIDITLWSVTDLEGIKNFTNLQSLVCKSSYIERLDVSGMTSLMSLSCSDNPRLSTLNVSGCTNLVEVSGSNTALCGVVAVECPVLRDLFLSDTHSAVVDITDSARLMEVFYNPSMVDENSGNTFYLSDSGRLAITDSSVVISTHVPVVPAIGESLPVQTDDHTTDVVPDTTPEEKPAVVSSQDTSIVVPVNQEPVVEASVIESSSESSVGGGSSNQGTTIVTPRLITGEGIEGFVNRLYVAGLERNPDEEGRQYWINCYNNGMKAEDIARGFMLSDEILRKNTTNEHFIKTLYEGLFNREADEAGLEYWMEALRGGMSRAEVAESFISSTEFNAVCEQYNANR